MALQGNPFEKRLSGKGPEITRKPKEFPPLNPWDDPEPKKGNKKLEQELLVPDEVLSKSTTDNQTSATQNQEFISEAIAANSNQSSSQGTIQHLSTEKSPYITDSNRILKEIKLTNSTLTESQSTNNTSAENKITNNKLSQRQSAKSTLAENTSTPQRPGKHPARNKRATPKLTRKELTSSTLSKSTLTESRSTLIQDVYSKNQGRWMLPEHDALELLAMTDKAHKLTGNQWPVFLFMSLKAYEYDKIKGKRGDGIRRFAGSFLSVGLGLSQSTCNDAINELIAKGYVDLLEKNNYGGNLYRVKPFLLYRPDPNHVDRKSVNLSSANLTSDRNLTESQSGTCPKVSQDVDRKSDTIIDVNRSINNSLSQFLKPTQLTELETRWLSFMKKEREREEKGLLKLFTQKPKEAETILQAFEIILKEQDEYGEIKSAISVLETNYTGQYRAKALAAIARLQEKQKQTQTAADVQSKQTTDEDAEAQIQLIRMQCFEQAFPDLAIRKQYILNVCKDNPMFLKLRAGSPIATSYAVTQWAQGEGSAVVLSALDRETTQTKN
jgi:hypothetical protein